MSNIETRKCIVCDREFKTLISNNTKPRAINFRKRTALTCSHKCSRIFRRIYHYFNNNQQRAMRREAKK